MGSNDVRQIMVGNHRSGIIGLDGVLKEVSEAFAGRPDAEIEAELPNRLSKQNYIYEKVRDQYGRAFLREYKKYEGIVDHE